MALMTEKAQKLHAILTMPMQKIDDKLVKL
jgi:hypothetical protein